MRLHSDWRGIVRHAWSFRLSAALALAEAVNASVEYLVDGRIGAACMVSGVSIATAASRLIHQAPLSGEDA